MDNQYIARWLRLLPSLSYLYASGSRVNKFKNKDTRNEEGTYIDAEPAG